MITVRITEDGIYPSDIGEAALNQWKGFENRNDWKSLSDATRIAEGLTKTTGVLYIATDAGETVSPRYDVIVAPKVGDEVSYSFNGDTYPCGTIVKISESLRTITTSDGKKFYRRHQTGSWVKGGWSLVQGHHYEQNPHF